jgi:hypothetical protein
MKLRAIAAFFARFRGVSPLAHLLCGLLAIAAACSSRGDLELLKLRTVEIDEEAALLYVLGSGFVTGARCELSLSGTAYPTGGAAEAVDIELPCRALSDERSLVQLSHPAVAQRPRGFFEGTLTLRLLADDGERAVVGTLSPVRLRVGVYGRADVDNELALARAASRLQRELGIRAVEATGRGLALVALDDSGKLARAGARSGDVVQRCAGAPVEEASDLSVSPGASELSLVVLRRGAGPLTLRVPLRERAGLDPALCFITSLLAFVAALFVPSPAAPASAPLRSELPWLGGAVLLALASWALHGELDVSEPWLVALVFHKGSTWLGHARGARSTLSLVRGALDGALATLCIAALALSLGSMRVPLFAASDAPVDWASALALNGPGGWLAAIGLALALGPSRERAPREPGLALLRAVAAVELAVLGLGAARFPLALPWASGGLRVALGVAWLLLVAGLAYAALSRGPRPAHPRSWAGLCAPLAIALALLGPFLATHGLTAELCTALALGALAGRGVAVLGFTRARRLGPLRDPALSPFL